MVGVKNETKEGSKSCFKLFESLRWGLLLIYDYSFILSCHTVQIDIKNGLEKKKKKKKKKSWK